MDIFEQLEKAHNDLYSADIILKDYQKTVGELKTKIEGLERKAIEKLIEEKEQGSLGHIQGNTVYSYMRVNPKPIISDESKIPDKYFKTEKSIMKAEINKAIKDGEVIAGVTYDNGGYALTRKANLKW